jgi:ubiquinone/menaquinone biosynthesis C-methylase UbiE|nr:class I SAM-dependent methyltransferase [uncultured Acetatifactor sp.]
MAHRPIKEERVIDMLDNKGFDLWADGYDKSVGLGDEDGSYPFAGYKQILNEIYNRVLTDQCKAVLDIGFGTGALTGKLYEQGCRIWGQDFSERMIELAKQKMPQAALYRQDFAKGLAEELRQNRYDAVIATYSLHHLSDEQKTGLIKDILPLLRDGGWLYIGDVAFETRTELERQKALIGDEWDDEEIYFVADEFAQIFPQMKFEKFSFCAGLLSLRR